MCSLSRLVPLAFAGMMGTAAACGGGDSTGPKAGSVTGIAGDNDSIPTGGTLPVAFVILGSDGFPLSGAKVTWTVSPTTAASVTPTTLTTDGSGAAATTVHVGTTVGSFVVSGKVNGIDPVAFHLKAIDPCQFLNAFSLGATVSGALSRIDCKVQSGGFSYFYDFYRLDLPAGQNSIRINMSSTMFDTYVDLYALASGHLLGSDDDIQPSVNQNSQLDIILGQGGSYVIGANSYDPDTVGTYTLSAAQRATTLSGCQDAWATPGITIIDTVRTTDCVLNGSYFDFLWMYVRNGTVLQFAERSTFMDPLLKLYHVNFSVSPPTLDSITANNDSSATNTNAYISYTVPADGLYQLRLGTFVVGQTGEYTLVFSPTGAAPSAGKTQALDDILRFFPRTPKGWKVKG